MKLTTTYEPDKYESKVYALWEKHDAFAPKHRGSQDSYSIVVPPPNANGDLHLGHGLTLALEDIAVRYHRMKGKASLLLPGADHAGFETWVVYEKYLASLGKSRFDYSREELYSQIWDFVDKNKTNYLSQFRALGASVDWGRYTYTLDTKIVNQAYKTFEKMWQDGLIYRAEKLVSFCTYHGTGFADIEVTHKETKGYLWHVDYPLTDGSGYITVATTRPETLLGDTAVAVHPDDARYKKYIGKTVTVPVVNREIPIITDEAVDQAFGTGAVKITPAHDQNDFDMAERHSLPRISVIGHDGTMIDPSPEQYIGLSVAVARDKIAQELVDNGSLRQREEITHSVGHCYKCDTIIEPLLREQWFVRVASLAKPAIQALKKDAITFYPASKKKQLISYLENLRDWNISRQIAWGIPIPAFQSSEDPSEWIFDTRVKEESITKGGVVYHRDHDVFDTWFSSSSWPYATLDFPDGNDFKNFYPLSVMETGADILYPWVSRMIMLGLYTTGEVPFTSVYLHGLIQDENGQKMSKSKGNVVNPIEKVHEFGSDAFRMGILSGETAGSNRPYTESKIVGARNFCNKLWNVARFVQEHVPKDTPQKPEIVSAADHWLLNKLQHTTDAVAGLIETYRFSEAYNAIYHFVRDDFADWYIEASKGSANPSMLRFTLESILKICHPFAPFITEAIWQQLGWSSELLIVSAWPDIPKAHTAHAKDFEEIKQIVTESRQLILAMGLKKPQIEHTNDIVDAHKESIIRMAKLGDVVHVKQGRGLQFISTRHPVWMHVTDEEMSHYKDTLVSQRNEQHSIQSRLKQRLDNPGYTKSAPEHVITQTRDQLKESEAAVQLLEKELERF
jgi:valyl-tRNA synthetase